MLYIHLVSGLITDTILDLLATEDSYGEGGGLWGYILSYDNKKCLFVCLFVGCVEDHGPVIVTSLEVVSQLIHLVAPTDGCVFFQVNDGIFMSLFFSGFIIMQQGGCFARKSSKFVENRDNKVQTPTSLNLILMDVNKNSAVHRSYTVYTHANANVCDY